jgi:YidC/Oxa1 family membrane protein insertase
MAILLAMAVLFAWNYFFPVSPPPPPQEGDRSVAQHSEGMSGGAEEETGAPTAQPTSRPAAGTVLGLEHLGGGGLAVDPGAEDVQPQRIVVENEELVLTFDNVGARLVSIVLPAYTEAGNGPVELLPEGPGALASVVTQGERTFPLDGFPYRLVSDGTVTEGRRLTFELTLEELVIRKSFTVPPSGHLIQVSQEIVQDRAGISGWGLSWAGGMAVTEEIHGHTRGAYFYGTVRAEGEVKRKDPGSAKEPQDFPGTTYFAGVQNKYFLGAIVPRGENQGPARLWRIEGEDDQPTMAAEILVERTPGGLGANQVDYDVYVGPLDYAQLKTLGLGLEDTVDLGHSWIRPLSRLILGLLIWMHGFIPNYGIVIVLFSAVMNLLFFPLTYKSTKSMRDMSALKPQLDALKAKYKDEPQKMSEATMRLYKEAGVNPMAGCLPILLQMPIFFALYAVLFHTIELRQEPFLLWVRDLSQPDVVFNLPFSLPMIGSGVCILPIIMGITSFFQSKQTMVDPNQKAMLYMMPVMMTFIFFTMPSGLVLYWLTSNLFTISTKFFMKPTASLATLSVDDNGNGKKGTSRSKGRSSKRPAKAGAK